LCGPRGADYAHESAQKPGAQQLQLEETRRDSHTR
jgi:hypothetical protein